MVIQRIICAAIMCNKNCKEIFIKLLRVEYFDISSQSNKLKERHLLHKRITDLAELQRIYELGEVLGRGSFGTVVKANHRASNADWAIKIINKSQVCNVYAPGFQLSSSSYIFINYDTFLQRTYFQLWAGASRVMLVEREIHILKLVNHPNIILLDRVFESPKTIYLIFELCTGSLAKTFKAKKMFEETETLVVIRSLAGALSYLHKNDIVHRDLKLENILIAANPENPNDNLHIKVTDFGLSAVRGGKGYESMLHDCCGTLTYMAPEMLSSKSYSQQCDVWSMGIIMYILLVGKFPFYSTDDQQLYVLVRTQELDFSGLSCSAEAKHLLGKMLQKNPAFRMTAAEVETHPWISGTHSRLHAHSSNVLDMMRMWRTEMMEISGANPSNIAVGQSEKNYFETVSVGMIPTTGEETATAGKERSMLSKVSLHYKNVEKSTINESPYAKHRFWENAKLFSPTTANSSTLEPNVAKSPETAVNEKLKISVSNGTTDIRNESANDQTQRAQYEGAKVSERAKPPSTKPMAEKGRLNSEHHRLQSSRLPDFSHVPAKVDSNLANSRREAQAQRKRGHMRNYKL